MHHTASDGWSLGVFFHELAAIYAAAAADTPANLKALPVQYADYAVWQRRWLRGEVLEKQLAYWKDYLAGAPGSVDLPMDHAREPSSSRRGGHHSITLSPSLLEALPAFNRREGATVSLT